MFLVFIIYCFHDFHVFGIYLRFKNVFGIFTFVVQNTNYDNKTKKLQLSIYRVIQGKSPPPSTAKLREVVRNLKAYLKTRDEM